MAPMILANRRGAAFLLAVYFAALMLLVLGVMYLQRPATQAVAASLLPSVLSAQIEHATTLLSRIDVRPQ